MSIPIIRNTNTPKISKIAIIPAEKAYFISTVAPTSTNNISSAATHSFENFVDIRLDASERTFL